MSYRFRRLVAFIALESWASHAASCPKPPPLDVAELDGAITSFRAAATDQLADAFTKPLPRDAFTKFRCWMGMG